MDQGFYPDGIYTAPDEEALRRDIELSLAAGFNGARLHQKAFEPRFLYHCDAMGYMVWGEYGNWGMDYSNAEALPDMLMEWLEILNRDYNHPSIICWCPFNETWDYAGRRQNSSLIQAVYRATSKRTTPGPALTPAAIITFKLIYLTSTIMNRTPIYSKRDTTGFLKQGNYLTNTRTDSPTEENWY